MSTQAQNFADLVGSGEPLHNLMQRVNNMALWVETLNNNDQNNPQATVYGFADGSALSISGDVFTVEQN